MRLVHTRRSLLFAGTLGLFAGLFPERASAQVVIRERVDLGAPTTGEASGGSHTVRLIAPEDGILRVEYGVMQRSAVPYPQTGISLRVLVNGTQVVDDNVFNRTWNRSELTRFCQGSPYTEHYYTTTDTLEVGAVETGDTLDFLFVTDRGLFGDEPLEGEVRNRADGRFDVDMWKYDTSCQQFTDRLTVIAEVAPVPSFIRQDNTAFPADSCLMVSRVRTNLNLPASATFAGPVPTVPDPYTFRVEARGIASGAPVTFQLKITDGGSGAMRTFDYESVEGQVVEGADQFVAYRMNRHVRLVSNGVPATGADPGANYDDKFLGEQTVLVRLGDTVRGDVLDEAGTVLASTLPLPVGCAATLPDPHPQAIRTARVYFRDLVGARSNPIASVARASEDWTQAAIRFRLTGRGPDITPVTNILQVEGQAGVSGPIEMRVKDVSGSTPITLDRRIQITPAHTTEDVARLIAESIDADPRFEARHVVHNTDGRPDHPWWVLINPEREVNFQFRTIPAGLSLGEPPLNFPPLVPMAQNEHHALALNFKGADPAMAYVFTEPDGAEGPNVLATAYSYYNWRNFMPGAVNTTFVDRRALDGTDATFPFTFGHELGHLLSLPHDDATTHNPPQTWNLMYAPAPAGEREGYGARKRLRQEQVNSARQQSGPSSANPLLQQNRHLLS